jgi:hypothetical protein
LWEGARIERKQFHPNVEAWGYHSSDEKQQVPEDGFKLKAYGVFIAAH